MALLPPEALVALVLVATSAGIAYYGYSSHKIGQHFGMVSVPYAALYAALLVTALSPAIENIDRPAAVIMSLVSWGLFAHAVRRSKVARWHPGVKAVAVVIGFFALVVFPLFSVGGLQTLLNVLYRLAAICGWIVGARPGFGPKK